MSKRGPQWVEGELSLLRQCYSISPKEELLSLLPNRTWVAICLKAEQLRIKRPSPASFKKGHTPWNKGAKGLQVAWNKGERLPYTVWNKGLLSKLQPFYGHHHTDSAKQKQREGNLGKVVSAETREKQGAWQRGRHLPESHRMNVKKNAARYWLGKHLSVEHRKCCSESRKALYETNPEVKDKISVSVMQAMEELCSDPIRYKNWLNKLQLTMNSPETKAKSKKASEAFWNSEKAEGARVRLQEARLHQVIPTKDTTIEVFLQDALNEQNIIFETHKSIFGQPDIFIEPNICIFADGDYWHNLPKSIERDVEVNRNLTVNGYVVLRFMEHQIRKDLASCIEVIRSQVLSK